MDALCLRCAILAAAIASMGAGYRTTNFVVEAPTPQMAEQIGQAAEKYRHDLAIEWLGKEMPNWSQPCPIKAEVGDHLGAGGATSFFFEHGEVYGWRMTIQGSLVRILDSVLPHEVTHTVFATHFRQPLPRWADEGACTTVEHVSEKTKQQHMLIDFLRTGRGIAFSQMFAMREYPHDVMPLYSQGYSVARFLVAQGGQHKFINYLADGLRDENWTRATQKHYGFDSLLALQNNWLDWVKKGSPALNVAPADETLVAVKSPAGNRERPSANLLGRRGSGRGTTGRGATPGPSDVAGGERPGPSVYDLASNTPPLEAVDNDVWRPRRVAATPVAREEDYAPTGDTADKRQPQQVTRPQEPQRPRQVILEWNRPGPGEAAAATRPSAGVGG